MPVQCEPEDREPKHRSRLTGVPCQQGQGLDVVAHIEVSRERDRGHPLVRALLRVFFRDEGCVVRPGICTERIHPEGFAKARLSCLWLGES
ncbi:hypothetical protein JYJ95_16485 [Corallococcus exiguus]|uniref:hypothetical protein n=1 Tax=Corallococcus exiguus TaxID=83462 RepID=UPI001A908535|nr:hypothetical protein [Corallococcus exiguus]MBN8468120.1 hypothetical protein [Corallococcus exiguus]